MTKKQKIFSLAIIGVSFGYILKVAYDLGYSFADVLYTPTED